MARRNQVRRQLSSVWVSRVLEFLKQSEDVALALHVLLPVKTRFWQARQQTVPLFESAVSRIDSDSKRTLSRLRQSSCLGHR